MDIFTKQKLLIRIIVFLIVLNLGSISFFIWRDLKHKEPLLFPKNEDYKDVTSVLKKELNLSDNQVLQFDEIRKRNFEKQSVLKKIIRDDKDAMNSEMFNVKTDETKIEMLAIRISDNEYKMEMLRFDQAKELKAVCNKKQLEKFENLVKEIRDYFRPDNQPNKR